MTWNKFSGKERISQTCASSEYTYTGDWKEIPLAVRDALAEKNFPKGILEKCRGCWASGSTLPTYVCQYLQDLFDSWVTADGFDDNLVKGDVSEVSFCMLRQHLNSGKPVVQRQKLEAISSRTAGWDLIEIFFDVDPWFILWEIKGTDKHPESQSRSAAKQVIVGLKGKTCLKLKATALQGGHRVGLRWGSKGFDGWLGLRVGSRCTNSYSKDILGARF